MTTPRIEAAGAVSRAVAESIGRLGAKFRAVVEPTAAQRAAVVEPFVAVLRALPAVDTDRDRPFLALTRVRLARLLAMLRAYLALAPSRLTVQRAGLASLDLVLARPGHGGYLPPPGLHESGRTTVPAVRRGPPALLGWRLAA